MKIIQGGRQSGKTARLIKVCAENGGYIVCRDPQECNEIARLAEKLGCNIPYPITYGELKKKEYYGPGIRKIHIDNADYFLQYMCNLPIETITITTDE